VPRRPTPAAAAGLAVLLLAALAAAVASAGPAAAAQDPGAPQATVTKGPSCDPGGMEIKVVAGTAPYAVRLATTRNPGGEDTARLAPDTTILLHTDPFDWGETVDPRLEYTALDASGTSFTDELDDWTMTRPSREDCAAIGAPAAGPPSSTQEQATSTPGRSTPAPEQQPAGTTAPDPRTRTPDPTSAPPTSSAGPSAVVASGAAGGDGPSSLAVGAGRPITVRATGFRPGEDVSVRRGGRGDVLGRATAGPDGTAEVPLFVPADASGQMRLDIVGAMSGVTTGLRLQVAAQHSVVGRREAPFSWPALLALLSLVGSGAGLVATLGRPRTAARAARPLGSA
jgi:hypothetical protein